MKIKSISIQILILSLFHISILKAVPPLIVSDPQANINTAATASRMAESLSKASEMIEKYTKMIEKAQEQVNELNKINDMMNQVDYFLNSSSIGIANPLEVMENLKDIPDRMVRNLNRLKKTIDNYKIRDHIHSKNLNQACPWLVYEKIAPNDTDLAFTKTGKESDELKAIKKLAKALDSNIVSNSLSVAGTFSGRAMALEACSKLQAMQQKVKRHEFETTMKKCLLEKDFDCYRESKMKWITSEMEFKKNMRFLQAEQTNPLLNRSRQMLEKLGVLDKSFNKKEEQYCEPGKNDNGEEFCYPKFYDTTRLNNKFTKIQNELLIKLQKAGSDEKKQAKAYVDIKEQTNMMLLEYVKDIANNLSFMNETISLIGNLISRDFKYKYEDDDYFDYKEEIDKQVSVINDDFKTDTMQYKGIGDYKVNLDEYGFPIVSFTSSSK
ncbi:hypothetical protein BKH42_08605 [Helicobacter sp. 13S00482-2]|uniref:hypothetical protein n=1 Tax=Helicobacter sp. 13S00482-2 TaxID=1476200 RepID=UPI000BA72167|nr:hypothetical protein [Helicobacter sp. 13S00482-2]PAF52943.1 hypothetical protein BKH42_08605 [Helicobacter sp. 13S00482-2]